MYRNILVPIAFDDTRDSTAALEVAEALLTQGGTITALHVIEEMPAYAATYVDDAMMQAAQKDVEAEMAARLGGRRDVGLRVVTGHSGRTIIDEAEATGTDLIVIASHRPGLQDYFLGSTAARVVRHAPCSVHVIR